MIEHCDVARLPLSDTASLIADYNEAKKQLGKCAAKIDGLNESNAAHNASVGIPPK